MDLRYNALRVVDHQHCITASIAPHLSVRITKMSRVRGGLWKKYIAVQIYGANTDVGKTVFSTLLGLGFKNGLMKQQWKYKIQYIKPVSTGPFNDRDDKSVRFSNSVVQADLS